MSRFAAFYSIADRHLEMALDLPLQILFANHPPAKKLPPHLLYRLCAGIQHACDGAHHLVPARPFVNQLPLSSRRQRVILGALATLAELPFGLHPLLFLQTVERRIERAGLYPQHVARIGTNGLGDPVSMPWSPLQHLENEHIERSLQQLDLILILALAHLT